MAKVMTYDNPILNSAVNKSWKRLVPLIFILYFIAFIDRVNIGFAKDVMAADIGLSATAYAFGAGIFFASYAIFGIPANLMLNKFGAQKWLGITTIIWGALCMLLGFVRNETEFVIVRFLLGAGEAGFYPGILLLASIYFPDKVRGSVIGSFALGVSFALALGSPLSGALLEMGGLLGRPSWFWMFNIEGLMGVIMGIVAYFYLDDSPSKARFLTQEEKDALNAQLKSENPPEKASTAFSALKNLRVWHLAFIYGLIQISAYGLVFFLPSQVAALMGKHASAFQSSVVSAIPWICSGFGVYYIPRLADRYPNARVWISTLCMVGAALGLAVSAYAGPVIAIIALSFCAVGFLSVQPVFWVFPPQVLTGSALATGIAFCTTIGAACSFFAPNIRVGVEQVFHSTTAGLVALAIITFVGALLILTLKYTQPAKKDA